MDHYLNHFSQSTVEQHTKKELGNPKPRLFNKNIASWPTYKRYILPSELFNGRGTLTVQR